MDLAAIQKKLTDLGVPLIFHGDPPDPARQSELQLHRQYRASLYVDRLTDMQTYLTTTLAGPANQGGLGSGYPFVRAALAGGDLLNQLAAVLDTWICPAVCAALNHGGATYENWFQNSVFNADEATYRQNVANFRARYAVTDSALRQITANFRNNIRTMLLRLLGDRTMIVALFDDRYPSLALTSLSRIVSTGSDFHKGGQQVMILTFDTKYWAGSILPTTATLDLVYKPADVEVDCLITGDSAAVRRATRNPGFLARSLVEILNDEIGSTPQAGQERLPTYRILPRRPTSTSTGPPYPVRGSYGWIEYLDYDYTELSWSYFNFFGVGRNDFVIGHGQQPLVERFYRQAGELTALAMTFLLTDLHFENVRVRNYQPHLIDLEICLTMNITELVDTALFDQSGQDGKSGGLTGFEAESDCVDVARDTKKNTYSVEESQYTTAHANRLCTVQAGSKSAVSVDPDSLLAGLRAGLDLIRTIHRSNGFRAWLDRARNVLVRIIPVATPTWTASRKWIYWQTVSRGVTQTLGQIVLREQHSLTYIRYQRTPPLIQPEPLYVAVAAPQVRVDLEAFDIPTFYHRLGTDELLDSNGTVIDVPAQVTVYNSATQQTYPVNSTVQRTTYFDGAPYPDRVEQRLNTLTGDGFPALQKSYEDQARAALGLSTVSTGPSVMT